MVEYGFGILIYSNAVVEDVTVRKIEDLDIYIGQFKDGKFHGFGLMYFQDKTQYEGYFW